jgi:uncharacterized membrane protein HdeD (DUF308 family)
MKNINLKTAIGSTRFWYLPLITGIIFVLVGIWVLRTPLGSYVTLALLFSLTFLVTGLIEIIYAIVNRKSIDSWGWSLAGGIIDFLIGMLLISQPEISIAFLPIYIGFGILFRSAVAIGWAIELKKLKVLDWGNLLGIGILGSIFAFIILWNPLFAGMTLVIYTGIAFLLVGLFQIYHALRLRKIKKALQ